jgi:hypothetical protein
VTGPLARLVLALYPFAFRRRYGDEMRALLEEERPGPRAVADLLRGAVRAHLHPAGSAAALVEPADRVRLSSSGVLVCWVLFAAAGSAFYKTTEDYSFSVAGHAHPLLRDAHLVIQAAAVIGSSAIVLGALPLIVIAFIRARTDLSVRRYVVGAVAPVLAFAGSTALLVAIAHATSSSTPSTRASIAVVLWSVGGLGCGLACALACRAVLFEIPVPSRWLRSALASGTVVTTAMLAVGTATAIYAIALMVSAPVLAGTVNGPFQLVTTCASLIVQAVAMAVLCALAGVTVRRGWTAASRLDGPPRVARGESGR